LPTREEILQRARSLVPQLREQALDTERNRRIPAETHRAFEAAGLYKLFQPARYGGYEMPIGMMIEVAAELGRGCGSSAWVFTNLAVQNWEIGMTHPRAQEEVWGRNPAALAASSFPVKGGKGRRVEGGLVLDGTWSFASGVDFADWQHMQVFLAGENAPPSHHLVLVPKADFTVEDDWFVTGLSGTGSKSIVLKQVFVPEHRVLATRLVSGGPSPGNAVNANPLYSIPPLTIGAAAFAGPALGIARGALELIEEEVAGRLSVGGAKLFEQPTVQLRVSEASAEIRSAHVLLLKACDEAMSTAESGEKPPIEQRARWRRDFAYAGQLCVRAVERLYPLVGGRGLQQGSPFQLAWRDVHAAVSQVAMAWDLQAINAARVQFGLASLDPRL
jgi:3-hydroxy-9,10-secoandrosta-1,3,5(10)-triene-9,17-dione monooxygenase